MGVFSIPSTRTHAVQVLLEKPGYNVLVYVYKVKAIQANTNQKEHIWNVLPNKTEKMLFKFLKLFDEIIKRQNNYYSSNIQVNVEIKELSIAIVKEYIVSYHLCE